VNYEDEEIESDTTISKTFHSPQAFFCPYQYANACMRHHCDIALVGQERRKRRQRAMEGTFRLMGACEGRVMVARE
jgi:hypothetical protein